MLSIPIRKFSPKWEPGKSHFLSNLLQSLIIKHWTLLYFQKKTLEIIMKQLGPEVTINPNFGEIRKQSLDNYFETCLTKHCDVTTLYLKEWKQNMRKSPVSGEKLAICRWIWTWTRLFWPILNQTTHRPQCRRPPLYRHAVPAKPVLVSTLPYAQWQGKHKFVVPKCTNPQSQKLHVVNNLQPFFHLTSLPPSTNRPPNTQHSPLHP